MAKSKRLLFVLNHSYFVGGGRVFVESAEVGLMRDSTAAFNTVGVAAFKEAARNSSLGGEIDCERFGLHQLSCVEHGTGHLAKLVNYIYAFFVLPFVISKYSVIYVFVPGYFSLLACLWSMVLQKPFGLYVRGAWRNDDSRTPWWWGAVFRKAAFIIATGEAFMRRLRVFNSNVVNEVPLTVLRPGPVDFGSVRRSSGIRRVLFAGRMIESKGIFDVLRATRILLDSGYLSVSLVLAGGGTEEEVGDIQKAIRQLGVESSVRLCGQLSPDEMAREFEASDLFAFPSYYPEGFPRVLYEAMMFGVPIVTTPMPGLEGFLVDKLNCFFCNPRDPGSLADVMGALIRDPRIAVEAANRAREDVTTLFDTFQHSSHSAQLIELACGVLGPTRAG